MMTAVLTIDDLHMEIDTQRGVANVLNGVSLEVHEQEIVGLIGETGAGKSMTGWATLGLLESNFRVTGGSITFDGRDLLTMDERGLRAMRGNEMAVIVQNPRGALDPLRSVGRQIAELHATHRKASKRVAREKMLEAIRNVGIPDAERRSRAYAHQMSGGMVQRVLIAMAMVNEPKLIIADEPTTGLDLTVQAQILDLLREKVRETRSSILLITHDLGVVANYCDRVGVMFAGRIVEQGTVQELFANPQHPYTRALIAASGEPPPQSADAVPEGGQQLMLGSTPPHLLDLPSGCHYAYRCPFSQPKCREDVPTHAEGGHEVLCHFPRSGGWSA